MAGPLRSMVNQAVNFVKRANEEKERDVVVSQPRVERKICLCKANCCALRVDHSMHVLCSRSGFLDSLVPLGGSRLKIKLLKVMVVLKIRGKAFCPGIPSCWRIHTLSNTVPSSWPALLLRSNVQSTKNPGFETNMARPFMLLTPSGAGVGSNSSPFKPRCRREWLLQNLSQSCSTRLH